jgi:hypothetical protein
MSDSSAKVVDTKGKPAERKPANDKPTDDKSEVRVTPTSLSLSKYELKCQKATKTNLAGLVSGMVAVRQATSRFADKKKSGSGGEGERSEA